MIKMRGVDELDELRMRKDVLLVDLRNQEAYLKYHIKGAKNYPYEELEQWEKELLRYRKILLYCERGSESLMVARRMNRRTNEVYTIVGGIEAVYALEKRNSIDRGNGKS